MMYVYSLLSLSSPFFLPSWALAGVSPLKGFSSMPLLLAGGQAMGAYQQIVTDRI